jgi:hypothetical protein
VNKPVRMIRQVLLKDKKLLIEDAGIMLGSAGNVQFTVLDH